MHYTTYVVALVNMQRFGDCIPHPTFSCFVNDRLADAALGACDEAAWACGSRKPADHECSIFATPL
jgi:hypothetical protein